MKLLNFTYLYLPNLDKIRKLRLFSINFLGFQRQNLHFWVRKQLFPIAMVKNSNKKISHLFKANIMKIMYNAWSQNAESAKNTLSEDKFEIIQ